MITDRLIAAIATAILSGITFIAYKHPDGYRRMFWPIVISLWACSGLWAAYSIGQTVGRWDARLEFLKLNPTSQMPTATTISPLWMWMLPGVVVGYLLFLRFLPDILHSPKNGKDKKPKEKVNQKDSDTNA
jgi:TRAP-type C4-dicarboxylate transport system permease small subunit